MKKIILFATLVWFLSSCAGTQINRIEVEMNRQQQEALSLQKEKLPSDLQNDWKAVSEDRKKADSLFVQHSRFRLLFWKRKAGLDRTETLVQELRARTDLIKEQWQALLAQKETEAELQKLKVEQERLQKVQNAIESAEQPISQTNEASQPAPEQAGAKAKEGNVQ